MANEWHFHSPRISGERFQSTGWLRAGKFVEWENPAHPGDEHRPRPLAIGELLEQRLLLGKDLPAEMLESIDNPFQCIVSAFLLWRIGLNAPHTVWHGSEPR